MARVIGIDHLVLSVGDFARSKDFYGRVLGFLGFKLKHESDGFAGWSNGTTLLFITPVDGQGRWRKYRKGDIGFHHYAFELENRKAVDDLGAFLAGNGFPVADPPGSYNGDQNYYAVFFTDPDGMRLEGMHYAPARKPAVKKKAAAKTVAKTKKAAKKTAKRKVAR